jgi:hypothetical protein
MFGHHVCVAFGDLDGGMAKDPLQVIDTPATRIGDGKNFSSWCRPEYICAKNVHSGAEYTAFKLRKKARKNKTISYGFYNAQIAARGFSTRKKQNALGGQYEVADKTRFVFRHSSRTRIVSAKGCNP